MRRSPRPLAPPPMKSEFGLVCSLTEFLVNEGYDVRLEVSNMGQSIDVVATKGRGRWVTAIEAKRSNWRRALAQCRAHTLVCDYVAVALAIKRIPEELRSILESNGWGLLLFNFEARCWSWELKPRRNHEIWQPQRKRFLAHLREVSYVA